MSKIILSAVGDISFSRSMPDLIAKYGYDYPFENVQRSFEKSDILMGSLECVYKPDFFPKENANEHFQAFAVPVKLNQILMNAGFNVLNIATNHALDCGLEGFKYTAKVLKDSGFAVIGGGESKEDRHTVRIIDIKGCNIGFLGYTDSSKWILEGGDGHLAHFKAEKVIKAIKENKSKVDILIVSWHADLEFANGPSIPRYDSCHQLIEAGANAVICHHPHVPQGVEEYKEGLILYSLGNFVFDTGPYQKKHSPIDSLRTFIFNIEIENRKIVSWNREYFKIIRESCRPEPLNKTELQEFKTHFKMLDELVQDREKIRKEWHRICQYWIKEFWTEIVETGPDDFIEQWGWVYLNGIPGLAEGIKDMADVKYAKHKNDTYDWVRPYFPFEDQ